MIVTCSECKTKFKIADAKVTAGGVKVRCSKCKHTFLVTKEGEEQDLPLVSNLPPPVPPRKAPAAFPDTASVPAALPPGLISSIDLDSDLPLVDTGSLPSQASPSRKPLLGEDLFADLDAAVDKHFDTGDDPGSTSHDSFAGMDSSSSNTPSLPLDRKDPFSNEGAMPSQRTGDLFDESGGSQNPGTEDLPGPGWPSRDDDPFGGELFGEGSDPKPAVVKENTDLSDDPFSSLGKDPSGRFSTQPVSSPDLSVGHDPFADLAGGINDSLGAEEGGDLLYGNNQGEFDLGSSSVEKLPAEHHPPRAPIKQAPLLDRSPLPMAALAKDDDESNASSLGLKIGLGAVLVVMTLFAFVVFKSGGKPDLTQWSTYVEAFTGHSPTHATVSGLQIFGVSSTLYPNCDGHPLVVIWGKLESDQARHSVVVKARLLDQKGSLIQALTVPAGVIFPPAQVYAMTHPQAVAAAYRKGCPATCNDLPAGGQLDFMIVMFDHPAALDFVQVTVEPALSQAPFSGLSPAGTENQTNEAPGKDQPADIDG
jgi:predicted Zn finger-like uncharacterized protein